MNTQLRRKKIEEILHTEGFCNVTSLARVLGVSEVTIRNDLSALEDEGKVTRIHGGAILAMERARGEHFEERTSINQGKKLWIARRAAELIENYDSILLDASTTAFYIADYLKNHHDLTVFTNGIEVAFRLAENRSNKVVLTGGLLRPETASLTGQFGNGMLGGIRANKAFFSCTGWSPTMELMDDDLFEAQLKKEMVDAAEFAILLVDSSKFTKQGVATFAPMSRVGMVITDDQVSADRLTQLRQAGIQVSICSEHTTRVVEGGNGEERLRIGFASQDDASPFSMRVRQGLVQAATAANIELLLADNHNNGPTALANADYFIQERVDLVVEFNTDIGYNNVIMEHLQSAHIPVIAVDIPMPGATFVGVDNYRAGLMAGRLVGTYVSQLWKGRLIKSFRSDYLPLVQYRLHVCKGRSMAYARSLAVPDEHILHLDSKNTYEESHKVVLQFYLRLRLRSISLSWALMMKLQWAHLRLLRMRELLNASLRLGRGLIRRQGWNCNDRAAVMIGSVTSFPEHYGELIIATALLVLQGKQVPPAVYTHHMLVLSEETKQRLDLSRLSEEMISILEYDTIPFSGAERNPSYRRLKAR